MIGASLQCLTISTLGTVLRATTRSLAGLNALRLVGMVISRQQTIKSAVAPTIHLYTAIGQFMLYMSPHI